MRGASSLNSRPPIFPVCVAHRHARQCRAGQATAKAIDYTLRRWPAIARYVESGILPIDNNPVENAIRPIAIGKKNWLYAGSERAGRRAAAIQSLLGTARLNGIEPLAWLNRRIDELLPLRTEQHKEL